MTFQPHDVPLLSADLTGVGGTLRARTEDFAVDEVPAYPPLDRGDHLFLRFWKRDLDTPSAIRAIARELGVPPREVGFAGMKDRRAITTQWASFFGASTDRLSRVDGPNIRILEARRHPHKLRTGHLKGNRFSLLVREPVGTADDALRVLRALEEHGCPNYYGDQRFGRDNVALALEWANGGRAPRSALQRRMLASTLQAAVFNEVVAERVRRGTMCQALPGDVFRKEESGGLFSTDDLDEAQARIGAFEISATGPMPGPKMRTPSGDVLAAEEAAQTRLGVSEETWRRFGRNARGTRRALRVRPSNVSVRPCAEGLRVGFELPSGAYATVVMREVMERRRHLPAPSTAYSSPQSQRPDC